MGGVAHDVVSDGTRIYVAAPPRASWCRNSIPRGEEAVTMDETMDLHAWAYRGVRAAVILHERELRRFLDTWKVAKARRTSLAGTLYEPGKTLEDILVHVLHWARDYIVWSCEKLQLPDPGCAPIPAVSDVEREADDYVEHLLGCWKQPFRSLPEDAFYEPQYRTRWGNYYPVEALLEHAVVHPMRHRLQLEDLMGDAGAGPPASALTMCDR
ncbi:MAG: hypothetical protein AB1806_12310 [Acidobacteriota bacterium]